QNKNAEISVGELMVRYLRFAKKRYVKNGHPTSEQDAIRASLRPLKELYLKHPANDFGPLCLKAVRQSMVKKVIARRTINSYVGRIQRMFKWAVSEELLPASVYQSLATVVGLRKEETKARETAPVQPVDDGHVEKTVPYLPPTIADMVRIQRLTGMRPGEVCIMRPCDIDRSSDPWEYTPESHKTEHHGRGRIVFLGPKTREILLPYLLREENSYCFVPWESEKKRNAEKKANRKSPMTPSQAKRKPKRNRRRPPGDHYKASSYLCAIKRACKKAGIAAWSPNQLRHSLATDVRKRYGLEAAQVTLGHSAADVTQIYAERDATLAKQIAKEVG
ncbi:MAG: site-specific integrase, partial [Planctomycetaceae bacterium]|nr:site-specific integrase [Planctomycetaceae bacterium]